MKRNVLLSSSVVGTLTDKQMGNYRQEAVVVCNLENCPEREARQQANPHNLLHRHSRALERLLRLNKI